MADITRVGASLDSRSSNWAVRQEGGLFAGEALTAGDAVMGNASTGKIVKSDGSKFLGMVARDYAIGEAVTVWQVGAVFSYGSGLTKFASLFASEAVDGALADATGAGSKPAVAQVRHDGKSITITGLVL